MTASIDAALQDWKEVVGAIHVVTQPTALAAASRATFATSQSVAAIISPQCRREVQACVRTANRYQIPLYPISTGKNWGYGSRVPPKDQCVLLDLSRMNSIIEVNEHLGYAVIEPGVTQRQLYHHLLDTKSNLMVPTTGSSPHTSILGNALERGLSAVGRDKNDCVCALEVVLPNGEYLQTGFGHLPNAQAANVYRWGVGPSVDGLFIQSSLGIVTRLTVWLTHRPRHYVLCIFLLNDSSAISRLINSIGDLFRSGGFPQDCGGIHLVNNYKMLAYNVSYPWAATDGDQPLYKSKLSRILPRRKRDIGWYGAALIQMPNKKLISAYKRTVRIGLKESADKVYLFGEKSIKLLHFFDKFFPSLRHDDVQAILQATQGPLFGIPRPGGNLRQVYWRKKSIPDNPEDYEPDRDHCGVIWLFVIIPFNKDLVNVITELIEKISFRYAFEPIIEIHATSHRSLLVGIAILFDRDVSGEDERALQCHDCLFDTLLEQGYYPYRLGIQHMGRMPNSIDYYDRLLDDLKRLLDPNKVIAPGRYEP